MPRDGFSNLRSTVTVCFEDPFAGSTHWRRRRQRRRRRRRMLPRLVAVVALPPHLSPTKCIQQVSTQPMSLCYAALRLSPLAPLQGYCAIWRTHESRYPPRVCVKDACVDKVDGLPTWSDWLSLASAPSTVEGCWSPLRCCLQLVATDRGNPPGHHSDFCVTGKSAKWLGSSRWSFLAIGEVFFCAGKAGWFLSEETAIR